MSTNGTNGTKRPVSSEERDSVNAACQAADGLGSVGGLIVCRVIRRVYTDCGRPTFRDLGTQLTFSRVGTDSDGKAEVKTVGRSESWVSRRLGRKGALAYAQDLSGDSVLADAADAGALVKTWTPAQHAEFLKRLHGKAVETVRSGAAGKRTGARKSRGWAELIQAAVRKATDDGIRRMEFLAAVESAFAGDTKTETQTETETQAETVPETESAFAAQLASFIGA